MASTSATTYAERLLENQYVQERLSEGVDQLRAAYSRASKRRTDPARDEKLRKQLREAGSSIKEAVSALQSGRTRPKGQRAKRVLVVIGLGVAGGAVAVVFSERLGGQASGDADLPERGETATETSGTAAAVA